MEAEAGLSDPTVIASRRERQGSLLRRIASAAVLLALVITALALGSPWIELLLIAVAGAALYEFRDLCARLGYAPPFWLMAPLSLYLLLEPRLPWHDPELALLVAVLAGLPPLLLASDGGRGALVRWSLAVGGSLYVAWLLSFYLRLYFLPSTGPTGLLLVLVVAGSVFLGDTVAMLAGKRWGRTPFFQRISPRKTVEGFLAGTAASGLLVGVMTSGMGLSAFHAAFLGVGVAVAAQAGDLVESQLKRSSGAKDSGELIPGHGGMLDRIDSLLFAGAAAFLVLSVTGVS